MPRSKHEQSPPQDSTTGRSTSALFQSRKSSERSKALTHERIAEHIDAFCSAGGIIEVLGTTRSLQRIGKDAAPEAPVAAAPRHAHRRKPGA